MRKAVVFALIGLIASIGFAQASQRHPLLNRGSWRGESKFYQENPTGTNEFGRTWKVQCEYEKFMKENPNGKNKFGKTFEEQCLHEKEFDIKSFLGFKFGEHCSLYTERCKIGSEGDYDTTYDVNLSKPFRMFDNVNLGATGKRRLYAINLSKDLEDVTYECFSNEVNKLVALFERQYKIELRWTIFRGGVEFENEQVEIEIRYLWHGDLSSRGNIEVKIYNKRISLIDREQCIKEKKKTAKRFDIPDDEGFDLMSATMPDLASDTESKSDLSRSRRLGSEQSREGVFSRWSSFPSKDKTLSRSQFEVLLKHFCETYNCNAVMDDSTTSNAVSLAEWKVGEGRPIWVLLDMSHVGCSLRVLRSQRTYPLQAPHYLKFDAEGRLVAAGGNFAETVEYQSVIDGVIKKFQVEWAKENGMTLEEALDGYKKWAEEKAQREAERAEQRRQLQAIQEELKRVREGKALSVQMEEGGLDVLLQIQTRYMEKVEVAKQEYDKLLTMKDRADKMSADARALYDKELKIAKKNLDDANETLGRCEKLLTPEKRAEYELKKKEKEAQELKDKKAKEEYEAMKKEFLK